ncbi:MAG: hypothetical protein JRE64_07695 [Deltaproteobacteria bacterium]|nr:hypothetical protein [Deltaproteobacteria bacterium]
MFLKKKINAGQARDTGLAMVLILLLILLFRRPDKLTMGAIVVLVLTMTWPVFFKLPGRLWFGFSEFLGGIVSKILLSLVFFIVATPVGLLRKKLGFDAMRLKNWKQDDGSVFLERNETFSAADLKKPY